MLNDQNAFSNELLRVKENYIRIILNGNASSDPYPRLGSGNSIVAGPIGSKLYALARIPSTGVKAYYRKYANQSLFANQQVRSEICKRFLQPGDTLVVDGSSNPKIQLKTGSFILLEWHHSPNHIGSLSLISREDHRLGANYAALHFESRLGGNQMFNVRYGQ